MQLGVGTLIVFIISVLIVVFITQIIWNNVMPDIFGIKKIDFWQTIGLLILANILFGGHCSASNVSFYQMS